MDQTAEKASKGLLGCLETCRRCENLVRLVVDSPGDHRLFEEIGPQLRHCLDYFQSLLSGLETGTIDYDTRERDPVPENDPDVFLAGLYRITAEMAGLEGLSTTQPVEVLQAAAPERLPEPVGSTLERELLFLSSHTIHHLALVVKIAAAHGVGVPADLGSGFSTPAFNTRQEIATN